MSLIEQKGYPPTMHTQVDKVSQESVTSTNPLTPRQREILSMLAQGVRRDRMGIVPETVKSHLNDTFKNLGIHDETQAVVYGIARGEIFLSERVGVVMFDNVPDTVVDWLRERTQATSDRPPERGVSWKLYGLAGKPNTYLLVRLEPALGVEAPIRLSEEDRNVLKLLSQGLSREQLAKRLK